MPAKKPAAKKRPPKRPEAARPDADQVTPATALWHERLNTVESRLAARIDDLAARLDALDGDPVSDEAPQWDGVPVTSDDRLRVSTEGELAERLHEAQLEVVAVRAELATAKAEADAYYMERTGRMMRLDDAERRALTAETQVVGLLEVERLVLGMLRKAGVFAADATPSTEQIAAALRQAAG